MQWCHEIRAHLLRGFQNSFVARAVIALEAQYSLARDEASHHRVPSSVLGHGGACGSFEEVAMAPKNPLCATSFCKPDLTGMAVKAIAACATLAYGATVVAPDTTEALT